VVAEDGHQLTMAVDVAALVAVWGSWAPTLSPDGTQVAYISDRRGHPELWVQRVDAADSAEVRPLSADPVVNVRWSADGDWLACAVATGGGVRTQVWVVRPDGRDARRVAGNDHVHAVLGPWSRRGHRLVVASPPADADSVSCCDLFDPATGDSEPVALGGLVTVLDLSDDDRFALLRDGRRGAHFCVTLDRVLDQDHPLLPYPETGTTEAGLLRPAAYVDSPDVHTAYLVTDAGRPRAALVAVDIDHAGARGEAGILAQRDDGELEYLDGDDSGRLLMLIWNVAGRSELEFLDTKSGRRTAVDAIPGAVITSGVLARDGSSAVLSIEGPSRSQALWRLDVQTREWRPVTVSALGMNVELVVPELVHFIAHDGLPLSGWLYRAPVAAGPGPVLLSFHGGPEAQERPVFSPNHQAMVAAGISVLAPNIRGSSGFGRGFAHADDRYGRYDGITDVVSCVNFLVSNGIADPARIAISGRSYGGYLTLAALVRYPDLFAAGVDICGMSDLLTFYRDTEPWIAAAAVTKYGDPEHDRALLEDLSPLPRASRVTAPLLVVHGALDTNVPLTEATQIVAALRELDRPVEYLELAGEGHEYRARSSRQLLLERMVAFVVEHLSTADRPTPEAVRSAAG
jgi:dipeptidyl aminopeptidase/acylaminoacyl peptidase